MNWSEFKKVVLYARRRSVGDILRPQHNVYVIVNDQHFKLNPFGINLSNGRYRGSAKNLKTGRYATVPNLKEEFR